MNIGLLGGTGLEGTGLALRLGQAGFAVQIGSRSDQRAQEKAGQLTEMLKKAGHEVEITGDENLQVTANSDLVFLTSPFDHAGDLLRTCREAFRKGAVLVDVTVPLAFASGKVEIKNLAEDSGSESLFGLLPPHVAMVAAFKTIPAKVLADLDVDLDCDVFVCGDDLQAKETVIETASRIPGLRALDAGALKQAGTLERMCALAIGLNRRYKSRSARFSIVGL